MALQISCLLLLATIALFQTGNSAAIDNTYVAEFEKIAHNADVRQFVQNHLPAIRRFIVHQGMDPMDLADFSDCVLPLPGILKGNINFSNGWLQQLSTLKSAKEATVSYSDKRLILDFTFTWDALDFSYEYDFRYLLIKRVGDAHGHLENPEIRIVVALDFLNYNLSLQEFRYTNAGKYTVKLEGHLLDPIFNAAAKAVTTLFKDRALRILEDRTIFLIQASIEDLNNKFPRPPNQP